MLASWNEFGGVLFRLFGVLGKIHISSLKVWLRFSSAVFRSWSVFCWVTFIIWSILSLGACLFRFYVYSWFDFRRSYVCRNFSISSRVFQFVGIWVFIIIPKNNLHFCGISCNISFNIFIFLELLNFSCLVYLFKQTTVATIFV
jgi:hypothetical protein